jgi:hypothetical protein
MRAEQAVAGHSASRKNAGLENAKEGVGDLVVQRVAQREVLRWQLIGVGGCTEVELAADVAGVADFEYAGAPEFEL